MSTDHPIVFIVPEFPPSEGGVGSYLFEIIQNIKDRKVNVIAPTSEGCEDFDAKQSFEITRVTLPRIHSLPFSNQLATFIPIWGYFWELIRVPRSVTIVCGSAHPVHMLLSWLLKKIKGINFIVVNYGLDILFPQTRPYRGIFNKLLRASDIVITISQASAEINRSIGVNPAKLRIISPPINSSKFKDEFTPEQVLEKYNLYGKKIILSVGRLIERKGFDTVIRALPQILKCEPNARYLIVGRGKDEKSLKALVTEIGLQDHVIFAGFVPDTELAAYYSACDVFVMISRELTKNGDIEGFGIVFLEANYFGKPVVGGRSGGVVDAIVDGRTGLLVDPTSPVEVSTAIVQLLQNKELATSFGKWGRSRVITSFTGIQAANSLLSIINGL